MNRRQFWNVAWEKSRLNLKSEVSTNYLSYAWWFLEPVIQMVCFYVIFELLLQRGGPGFIYFLLAGLVPWLWFAKTVSQGSNSLVAGRFIMNQISIPKLFFPLVLFLQCTFKQILVFATFLVFLMLSGFEPGLHWGNALIVMAIQMLFMFPVTCLLAYAVALVGDMKFIIPTVIQFLFFCTGIFFSFDRISSEYADYFFINPMAGIVKAYRDILLEGVAPDWPYLAKVTVASIVLLAYTLWLYRRNEQLIPKLVQE